MRSRPSVPQNRQLKVTPLSISPLLSLAAPAHPGGLRTSTVSIPCAYGTWRHQTPRAGAEAVVSAYTGRSHPRLIQEGKSDVANLPNPLDVCVMDLAAFKNSVREVFARDGVIDGEEERALATITVLHNNISQFRFRQHAAEAWVKGGEVTDYVSANFREAGFRITRLDDYRRPANVVDFPAADPFTPEAA